MKIDSLMKMPNRIIDNVFENVRIEPVDDPKINSALFSLYNYLIFPFEEIESIRNEIEGKQSVIQSIKNLILNSFKRIMKVNIPFGILSIVSVFGVAILFGEDNPYIHFWEWHYDLCETFILKPLDKINFPAILSVFLFIIVWFGGMYIFPLPIAILLVVLKNMFHKAKIASIKKEIDVLEKKIENKILSISDIVVFVPPSYRYSEALLYFVEAYANTKVSNLKEAINSYETFKHRRNVERSLFRIEKAMSLIAYQQHIQNEHLEYISKRIW